MINELQSQQGSNDDKKHVLEMLQRTAAEEEDDDVETEENWQDLDSDDDDGGEHDLAERLAEVDLNNADAVWELLTDAEQQEFKSIVHKGDIENIVKTVEPFWKQRLENKPVTDIQENEEKMKEIIMTCPTVLSNIKDFKNLSTKPPAKCIIYNIANVLGTYW